LLHFVLNHEKQPLIFFICKTFNAQKNRKGLIDTLSNSGIRTSERGKNKLLIFSKMFVDEVFDEQILEWLFLTTNVSQEN